MSAEGAGVPELAPENDSETLVAPPGGFRIYLGAAAGVGKTCAMLDEGWRRRERGRDVVIGFVETHGRPHTAEQIRDLEVVPRKKVEYRGAQFEEMDLDAVLARNPQLALVDELAHTNVPNSGRHAKRWEDVIELLDNGINVISTVNIQHLESLAESIEAMTGTSIRERVPDWVVRRADQTELVDSSPEQLRRRMIHGNVYPEAQVPAALTHFFTTRNLTILRELALRFVADETEEVLLREIKAPGAVPIETGEHFLVAVACLPGTEHMLRRAARITARTKGDLHVVHVIAADATRASDERILKELETLSLALGADWVTLRGDDVPSTLVAFAREQQITQLMVGSDPSHKWGMGRGGMLKDLLREAGKASLDVHVVSLTRARERAAAREEGPLDGG
ncbi:MAG TPA: sensor histidine kinase KdpD [Candidatus Dormibacteraeota bacterium]|nr:sensor histidine kinase KdpD [Candidatus Dormibacteraeota bacterium]